MPKKNLPYYDRKGYAYTPKCLKNVREMMIKSQRMSKKRKTYSAAFKAKVALVAQRQDKTISQLAAQFKVHPIVIARWKAQLLDNAEQVFQDKRAKKKFDDRTHDELYQEIGRLKVELDWVKKVRPARVTEKRSAIEQEHSILSCSRQCQLLELPRSTYYYEPVLATPEELDLMARIDRFHFEHPIYGSRRIAHQFGRGCLQELGGSEVEADGCALAVVAGESDGEYLFRALLRPVKTVLVKLLPNFYTPVVKCGRDMIVAAFSKSGTMRFFPVVYSMTILFDRRTPIGPIGMVSSSNPADVWTHWQGDKERWLFVSAHDDDIAAGAGLTLLAGLANGVTTFAAYFANGNMGYCSPEHRLDIARIREKEADRSFEYLGLPKENLFRFNYDDANLLQKSGRRFAELGECNEMFGASGLQNDITWLLRKVKPTRLFLPNHRDLHPDHQAVHMDMVICIFHAWGPIWPELGEANSDVPKLYEYATYSDFVSPPTMRIRVPDELVERRLESVAMYESQQQIGLIVEGLRKVGGIEYLLEMEIDLIQHEKYAALFTESFPLYENK